MSPTVSGAAGSPATGSPRLASRTRALLAAAYLLCALLPRGVEAQSPPRLSDVRLSADTVQLGDPFELAFTLRLAEGQIAFLPDSLEGGGFEPLGPVTWAVVEGEGARELRVRYPMIALDVGQIPVSDFEVFTGTRGDAVAAGVAREDDVVGAWEGFRRSPADVPSARLVTVPEQRIWVATLLSVDDIGAVVAPRPAADVVGGDVDWLSGVLLVLFGGTLLGVAIVSVRDWRASADRSRRSPPDPRSRALAALDALVAGGLHRAGEMKAFFTSSSDIVREYVEAFDLRWSRALTTTELMAKFAATRPGPDNATLASEMLRAERVKFAGDRPDVDAAESHTRSLRSWVEASTPPEPMEEDVP